MTDNEESGLVQDSAINKGGTGHDLAINSLMLTVL
jgi:hypothetical protein